LEKVRKLDVLAFGAHPDDVEISCGGTIASLTRKGKAVGIIDMTRGEMGTRGTAETRKAEAEEAAKILGVGIRENLDLPDTRLENKREYQLPVISKLRKFRPDICLINAPSDRHPDHGNAAQLVVDSLFLSGLHKIETLDDEGLPQEPWRPSFVFHYMQDRSFTPDLLIDITDTIEAKERALRAFATQLHVQDPGSEPETYISGVSFFESLRARAKTYGHMGGVEYAEPFKAHHAITLSDISLFQQVKVKR
jgi:bacillithiol biosynthesis deacetylase BshB1